MGNGIYRKNETIMQRVRNIRHKYTSFVRDIALWYRAEIYGGSPNWGNYPPSPVTVEAYPYQFIYENGLNEFYLLVSADEIRTYSTGGFSTVSHQKMNQYKYLGGNWVLDAITTDVAVDFPTGIESVYDVYTFVTSGLWLGKTTSAIVLIWKRVNL